MARFDIVRRFAAGALAASVVAACHYIVAFEANGPPSVPPEVPPDPCGPLVGPRDAGADANAPVDDDGGGTYVFAAIRWGFAKNGRVGLCDEPGFDLDGVDTEQPTCEPVSCAQHAGGNPNDRCDKGLGVDNALLDLLAHARGLTAVAGELPDLTVLLETGATNLVLELTDYNGRADDDSVTLSIYLAAGIEGHPPAPDTLNLIEELPRVWDGRQDAAWVIDERSVESVLGRIIARNNAGGFVRQHQLVIPQTGEGTLPGIFGLSSAAYQRAALMAQLVPRDAGGFELHYGRLGMRFVNGSLLTALGAYRRGAQTQLCEPSESTSYELLRGIVCGRLDLPATGAPNDPNVSCEELSATLSFVSVPSRISREADGGMVTRRGPFTTAPPCPDEAGTTVWCDDCAWDGGARRCDASQ